MEGLAASGMAVAGLARNGERLAAAMGEVAARQLRLQPSGDDDPLA